MVIGIYTITYCKFAGDKNSFEWYAKAIGTLKTDPASRIAKVHIDSKGLSDSSTTPESISKVSVASVWL